MEDSMAQVILRTSMSRKSLRRILAGLVTLAAVAAASVTPAQAVSAPLSDPRIEVHFNLKANQRPESIVFEPGGAADLALAGSNQIVRVSQSGEVSSLATLPAAPDGGAGVPVLGYSLATGLVRTSNGTLYVGYVTGRDDLNGIWRIRPGKTPQRIVATPGTSFPNGMDLDERTGQLYFSDSVLGLIWRVPLAGHRPTVWLRDPLLTRTEILGVNGLKIRNGTVWASNSDQGTLLRIPIQRNGRPGPVQTRSSGLVGIDDFAFVGDSNAVIAALNVPNRVELIRADGSHTVVLEAADGISGPTTIGIRGTTVYVASASYLLNEDPNLLLATLTP
jgi:hypothetical protein